MKESVKHLITQYFPPELQRQIMQYETSFEELQEIRCRVGRPLFFKYAQHREQQAAAHVSPEQMQYMVSRISQGSVYAWEEEFRRGYLTLPGGFRVGMTGKGVLEHGSIRTLKQISGLNFRIVREIIGAADPLMPLVYMHDTVRNCLIVSPPGGGKTTLLRDVLRQLSNGVSVLSQPGRTVAVVDERSELAGSVDGIARLDVGCRTDVLDGCPKCEGIRMMLRSMAPQVIAVDEIGTEADALALEEAAQSGVAVMATAHGDNLDTLYGHPVLGTLIRRQYFQLIICLQWNMGQVVMEFWQPGGTENEAGKYKSIGFAAAGGSRERHRVLQSI